MKTLAFRNTLVAIGATGYALVIGTIAVHAAVTSQSEVVAIVDGTQITRAMLEGSDEDGRRWFMAQHGRARSTVEDRNEMQKLRQAEQARRIEGRIIRIIRQDVAESLGVAVTDAEVEKRWNEIVGSIGSEAAGLKEDRKHLSLLVEALRRVYEVGEDPDDAYVSLLGDTMSRTRWEAHVRYDGTPERRELLRMASLGRVDEFDRRDVVRQMIFTAKLEHAVDEEIARTDLDYAKYLRLRSADPADEVVREKAATYPEARRRTWWIGKYRETTIEVIDSTYEAAVRRVRDLPE